MPDKEFLWDGIIRGRVRLAFREGFTQILSSELQQR